MLFAQMSIAFVLFALIFLASLLMVDAVIVVVFWVIEQLERWFYDD